MNSSVFIRVATRIFLSQKSKQSNPKLSKIREIFKQAEADKKPLGLASGEILTKLKDAGIDINDLIKYNLVE